MTLKTCEGIICSNQGENMNWKRGQTHTSEDGEIAVFEPYVAEIVQRNNSWIGYVCKRERVSAFWAKEKTYKYFVVGTLSGFKDKEHLRSELEGFIESALQLKHRPMIVQ